MNSADGPSVLQVDELRARADLRRLEREMDGYIANGTSMSDPGRKSASDAWPLVHRAWMEALRKLREAGEAPYPAGEHS